MAKLAKIITHHDKPDKAARLFAKNEIAAIGYYRGGSIAEKSPSEIRQMCDDEGSENPGYARTQLVRFRDEIGVGDVIIAYRKHNQVALIGRVTSGYYFDNENEIGLPEHEGGEIDYPHQKGVKWWEKPRDFHRDSLPGNLSEEVKGRQAVRVLEDDLDVGEFVDGLRKKGLQVDFGNGFLSEIPHMIYKIAWHPGGYKGGFCGNAQLDACEAFSFIRTEKENQPCSSEIFHCVDEHQAFADSGWVVSIHSPRHKILHELSEERSVVFLVAPLTKSKTRFRLVGFYTIEEMGIEENKVKDLYAHKNLSSKFDFNDPNLEFKNEELKKFFDFTEWTPRRNYDFISNNTAIRVLEKIYEIHENKEISDSDVNLTAMERALKNLRGESREDELNRRMLDLLHAKKQIILYGPAGTGKTFKTKEYSVQFSEGG